MRWRLILLLAAACTRPHPVAPETDDTPSESQDDTDGPPSTVLFLDSAGRAVPLACAAPGVGLYPDPGDCVELLGDDRTIGDLGNGRRTLGDESPWTCASNNTRRRAFRIESAPGRHFDAGDPANDLIVWPAARGFDVSVWSREPDPPPPEVAIALRWAEVAGTMRGGGAMAAVDARLYGTLTVDIDRDGKDDIIYSVGPTGQGAHVVLGALTTHPGEFVELLAEDAAAVQAYAALDLDGDGAPEIIVDAPTDDGDWTAVYEYQARTTSLISFSGIGC